MARIADKPSYTAPNGSDRVLVTRTIDEATVNVPASALLRGVRGEINILAFAVDPTKIGDGTVHPLSEVFGTLAAAQAYYPRATTLTQSLDWAAWQTALDAWGLLGGTLVAPPLVYNLGNTGLLLPIAFSGQLDRTAVISGLGATLYSTSAITLLGDTVPANISPAAVAMTTRKLRVVGLSFKGAASTADGSTGFRPIATYGLQVHRCNFELLDVGLDLVFALMADVDCCFSKQCVTAGQRVRDANGVITGGDPGTSGSNGTTLTRCRDFARTGQADQFVVLASDGVVLRHCITEGQNPVNAVRFDYQGGSTVKTFSLEDHHAENTPSGGYQLVATAVGEVHVKRLFSQGASKLIDGSGQGGAVFFVRVPYIAAVPAFRHGAVANVGPQWVFGACGGGSYDPTATANWVGGIVPTHMVHVGLSSLLGNQDAIFQGGGSAIVRAATGLVAAYAPGRKAASHIGIELGAHTQTYLGQGMQTSFLGNNYGAWWKDETNRQLKLAYKDNAGTLRTLTLPYTQTKLTNVTVNSTQTTIAHGLGYIPTRITVEPTSAGDIWRSAASDATNIYLTSDTNGRTADIYVG